jgi:RimJ/RimL family protein N-acetyltransferase
MHPQDVTSMHKACQPPSITKYMSLAFAYPYTLTHAQNWVAMNLKDNLPNYVITEHSTPEVVIGGIGLKPGTDVQSHTAEVGYWVAEEHWGKGYISEALSALTDYVFEGKHPGGYKRLFAGVFSGNDASMRCLQKCGYLAEGVLKGHVEKHGVIRDVHMFGLTKWDWEERRRQREGE